MSNQLAVSAALSIFMMAGYVLLGPDAVDGFAESGVAHHQQSATEAVPAIALPSPADLLR